MAQSVKEVVDELVSTEQIKSAAGGLRFIYMLLVEDVPSSEIKQAVVRLREKFPEEDATGQAAPIASGVFQREIAGI